jgi:uncharacterized membrane protein YeaQ/YmgE (transglycosylase-associated protein family)
MPREPLLPMYGSAQTVRRRAPILGMGRYGLPGVCMEWVVWGIVGASLGWAGCTFWGFNAARGPIVAAILGAAGGIAGGQVLAPLLTPPDATAGDLSPATMMFAVATAAVLLLAVNLLDKRLGSSKPNG